MENINCYTFPLPGFTHHPSGILDRESDFKRVSLNSVTVTVRWWKNGLKEAEERCWSSNVSGH